MSGKADPVATITKAIGDLNSKLDDQQKTITTLVEKANTPVYPNGVRPDRLFAAINGPLAKDSEGYSYLKAASLARGWLTPEAAKIEADTSNKLKSFYGKGGFKPYHPAAIIVPFSTQHMLEADSDADAKMVEETRLRVKAWDHRFDPDEAEWVNRRMGGLFNKALGTVSDAAGGTLVGFPTLGELIDLQRNLEVFANAGAQEVGLPANGRIQYPKLTGGSTAYWVGEAANITESTASTGFLDLVAKKLAILTVLNNELLRFTSPATEGMVRMDMARVAALKSDLAMLEGTGGTQPLGLINYPSASSWTPGQDKLLAYTVTSNTLQPQDILSMQETLPDQVQQMTAIVMRRQLFAKVTTRRADAVSGGDGKGPFVFSAFRTNADKTAFELEGVKVVRSSQVSNTRGGGGTQTYVLAGYFPDWLIGRFGVMEFLANGFGDTYWANDQTSIRGIQHMDAGARHASSFVFADAITIQ